MIAWERGGTVMHVAIFVGAPGGFGVRRVRNVNHPETPRALEVPARANGIDHVGLLMGDDVVGAAELRIPRLQIFLKSEIGWAVAACFDELTRDGLALFLSRNSIRGRGSLYLGQIKHLQSVSLGLRPNVDMVFDHLHVSPDTVLCLRRQPANILQASVVHDLHEGSPVRLAHDGEFAAVRRRPT